ncbi:GGDEF domain-containing protein [Streptomyces cinnamoneus]|uniref:GGDEF domain-containing protein n=1 Tax=Streptomyces cinnamoneus TaxID=53446 RepID=UPI00340B89C3
MSELLTALAAAAPLAAGWSLHGFLLKRSVEAARRDPLTGLPGRSLFQRRARKILRTGDVVVLLIDLDHFKALNDTHGHGAGDAVLATTAARLSGWAERHSGLAARLGGDEFAATITAPGDLPSALSALHGSLCRPVPCRCQDLQVGASVGAYYAAHLPEPALERAMRRADEAMYAAKRTGGGWQIADTPTPAMTTTNGRRTGRPGTATPAGGAR